MPYHAARELHRPRTYRLLTKPPFNVVFPSVNYRVEIGEVSGAPQWRLEAAALDGSVIWTLCQAGESRSNLERELFEIGFDLMHPTAPSAIVERLCAEGRATRTG